MVPRQRDRHPRHHGRLIHFLLELQDITERKRIESALRFSEENVRKLFQASPELLIVTTSDSTILEVNNSIERISGYKPEEVLGKTTDDLNYWVDKEDRGKIREPFLKRKAAYTISK